MKLAPYSKYKPSGVEWLGEVPEHWEIQRGKNIFECIDERSETGEEELLTVSATRGVIPRRSANVTMFKAESYVGYKLCWFGDLVINSLWAWGRGLGVSRHHGIVSTAYGVYRVRSKTNIDSWYLHTLTRSNPFQFELRIRSKGIWISRLQLTDESFLGAPILLPPLPEQTAIVRYLDYFDRRIRRYIHTKQKLIKLLEEEKRAVIHRAVTRGLDPDVPLKPSGVEWLGEVPEHWEVVAVKRHYSIQLGKMLQTRPNQPTDIEVPYLKAQHVQWFSVRTVDAPMMWASPRDIEQFGVLKGDLLVCEGGEGGRCGLIKEIKPNYIIQNALHRVRVADSCRNDYLQYVMSAVASIGWFDAINSKATIAHFTREKFGSLNIPLPPIPEQTAIVEYLDKATADIDSAITRARRGIDLLQEYRTRLIADVVTGKLDVREAAAALPDETDSLNGIA